MLDWQMIAVAVVVLLAVVYLVRTMLVRPKRGSGCGSCRCGSELAKGLISSSDLEAGLRRRSSGERGTN
jgi:hypothetical protein